MTALARVGGLLAVTLLTAAAAVALAPLGVTALYAVAALLVVGVLGYLLRSDLAPPLAAASRRVVPARRAAQVGPGPLASTVIVGVVAGLSAWVLASQGFMGIALVVGIVVLGALLALFWPLLVNLLSAPGEAATRAGRPEHGEADGVDGADGRVRSVASPSRLAGVLAVVAVGIAGAGFAWVASTLGLKGFVAVVGAIVLAGLFAFVKDRTVFFTFAAVCSLTLMLHKSFSEQDVTMSGGAISIYVTTFDVMIVLLYAIWLREGTLVRDLREGFRQPILWVPLIGALLALPSVLVSISPLHSAAELVRFGWMYLLFVYVAVRVRTRRQIAAILAGLVVFVAVELVVVVLQWRTGGVLGLDFLGVPTELGERTTDTTVLGRPFGTIIHPVFMAASLGTVAMLALAFALALPRGILKYTAMATVGSSLVCMYISQTRASLVAAAIVGLVVLGVGLRRQWIAWRAIGWLSLAGVAVGLAFFSDLSEKFLENFRTGHFLKEVESRLELNDVAGQMIADRPILGVGLNNAELAMPPYLDNPVIFFGHPVHNFYLLMLTEVGLVGFIGVLLVGVAMYDVALRLARSTDALFSTLGVGIAAAMAFLFIEELLGFSLRQDIPLALYWLLAGLAVAASRMAGQQWPGGRWTLSPPAESGGAAAPRGGSRQHLVGARAGTAVLMAVLLAVIPVGLESRLPAQASTADAEPAQQATPQAGPPAGPTMRPQASASASPPADPPTNPTPSPRATPSSEPAPSPRPDPPTNPTPQPPAEGPGTPVPEDAGLVSTADRPLVLSAVERSTGVQGIFTMQPGEAPVRVTPADGRFYNWPRWAFGNTKIIYTVRSGLPGSPEAIAMMNPDGTGERIIRQFQFTVAQPIIDPSGRWVMFTAKAPWFPVVALFRMDLATGEAVNITARTVPVGGFDSDPYVPLREGDRSADRVFFIWTDGPTRASLAEMRPNGTDRRRLTDQQFYDTDPAVAVDGRTIAIASYRGEGTPSNEGEDGFSPVKTRDFRIVTVDRITGKQRELTVGLDCTLQVPQAACSVQQMSGFLPRFTPDGDVSFTGALDSQRTCICALDTAGANPRVFFASRELAIDWFDWPQPQGLASSSAGIGSKERDSRLLLVTKDGQGNQSLLAGSPDLMDRVPISLPARLSPEQARWSPDRRRIVFTSQVPITRQPPGPAPPAGQSRRTHITMDALNPIGMAERNRLLQTTDRALAKTQVFLREADGSVRQLTHPWTEDWRDGVERGDARANTNPVFTPDGNAVIVTNTSTATGESFLLRIDLRTGRVLNLTNGTAGLMPTDDADPAVSPDGSLVAFAYTMGVDRGIYVMDARTGFDVREVRNGPIAAGQPAWGPDGRTITYLLDRRRGLTVTTADLDGQLRTRNERRISGDYSPALRPVVAPEGDRVLFLSIFAGVLNVHAVSTTGSPSPRLLQPDPLVNVLDVDWR